MIKNYTSKSLNSINKIQEILAKHKCTRIMFGYNDDGTIKDIQFGMLVDGKEIGYKLPCRVEKVAAVLYGVRYEGLNDTKREQAYRTAWANVRDWVDAQMAMIDTEQAEIAQIFLPYAVRGDGKTYFEVIKENPYLLEGGNNVQK